MGHLAAEALDLTTAYLIASIRRQASMYGTSRNLASAVELREIGHHLLHRRFPKRVDGERADRDPL
jgi:hypothetical protein